MTPELCWQFCRSDAWSTKTGGCGDQIQTDHDLLGAIWIQCHALPSLQPHSPLPLPGWRARASERGSQLGYRKFTSPAHNYQPIPIHKCQHQISVDESWRTERKPRACSANWWRWWVFCICMYMVHDLIV